jgi:hypothetical protein
MIGHLKELGEIWDTLNTYYERPEKYMEEALKPILEFRKYRVFDNSAIREFYSILRAAIKGAKGIGRLDLLVNDQMVPFSDWKEWATKRPGLRRVRGTEVVGCTECSCRRATSLGDGRTWRDRGAADKAAGTRSS